MTENKKKAEKFKKCCRPDESLNGIIKIIFPITNRSTRSENENMLAVRQVKRRLENAIQITNKRCLKRAREIRTSR